MTVRTSCPLRASASARPATESARPPVFASGAYSALTIKIFKPAASRLPPARLGSGPLADRHVRALGRTDVHLPRPVDPRIADPDLAPMRDPARQPADREDHGEHVRRDADRAHDDAAVVVDVRIELPLDEVWVG